MPKLKGSIFVLLFSGLCAVVSLSAVQASNELPPEMLADKYLIKAERLHAKEDYAGAFKVMEKIIALQKEHEFKLPDDFPFKFARVTLSAGSVKIAIDSVNKYLAATGRDGESYRDALALLVEAEEMLISVEVTCAGKPRGVSCWMALANHSQCYVWNQNYVGPGETATWSGNRYGVFAHGEGELRFAVDDREIQWSMGHLERGKYHGQWLIRNASGLRIKGEFAHNKWEGRWLRFSPASPAGERCESATFQNDNQVIEWRNVDDSVCDFWRNHTRSRTGKKRPLTGGMTQDATPENVAQCIINREQCHIWHVTLSQVVICLRAHTLRKRV